MAGVHDTEVIDLVAQAPDGGGLLVMVESRPWHAEPGQIEQLKAKFNTYAQFALDGELTRQFPDLADRPVSIRLDCAAEPPSDVAEILAFTTERLAEYGVTVTVNVNPRL